MKLHGLKNRINRLSIEEKKDLIDFIKGSYSVFDSHSHSINSCPCCQSKKIVKNGTRKGVQKYVCRSCNKNFNYRTGTAISRIQKLNKWNDFVEDFMELKITSLKSMKNKLGVSEQTAFNWRHKLLAAISTNTNSKFNGEVIEFDETYLRISRKGRRNLGITDMSKYKAWRRKQTGDSDYNVKVLFTAGRNSGQLDIHKSHTGRTSIVDMKNYFLPDKFKDIEVYTDKHITYKSFFKSSGIPHETFLAKHHISQLNKEVHNQKVNAHTRNFKDFVNSHMRGVSTKYLDFYVKWFQFTHQCRLELLNREKIKFDLADEICESVVEDKLGIELYRQSEISFQMFLKNNGRTDHGNCKNHFYANKIAA